ncbi:HEL185Cp [Eremothecium sinecaudum]|uniref:GPN-loop GTPase 2 n=1 Tax=Eremothecium sinecaudum TaxID=45286 RepID=A0A0X8HTC6_9SACH|nr:HEL185Cp [Eremothecium sinecaudum]AMD21096.1 HEL185Cp [Eremothecium sinecaudum]
MPFGQIVIGPPGSGKSTYCNGCIQFYDAIGRHAKVINMDPANHKLPYRCDVDIRDFITLEEIMNEHHLGPNGGLMFALESVEKSLSLFALQIKALIKEENPYLVFDCPGQVEMFTHNSALPRIFKNLEKELDLRLCVVNLVDSIYITSPSQYISVLLLALRSMLMMDLPHINVFSKIDMLSSYGELPFRLDYYTEVQDLEYLEPFVEAKGSSALEKRYSKLTKTISELVSDFNLVSFEVLCVDDKQSMINLQSVIDKSNGYIFGSSEVGGDTVWAEATRQGMAVADYDIQDRWIDNKELYDQEEQKKREELIKEQELGDKEIDVNEEDSWERALMEWDEKHSVPFAK